MARKKMLKYRGRLIKRDVSNWTKDDPKVKKFWDSIKDTLYFLKSEDDIVILNSQLDDIYRKFKNDEVEIIIQKAKPKPTVKVPDLDKEYDTTSEKLIQKMKVFLQDEE